MWDDDNEIVLMIKGVIREEYVKSFLDALDTGKEWMKRTELDEELGGE